MTYKVAQFLISFCDTNDNNEEIIEYGVVQGLNALLGVFLTLLAGCILGIFTQSVIFIIALIPLRMYAGGYHADTQKRCAIISILLMLIALMIIRYVNISPSLSLVISLIETGILFCVIPIDGSEKLEDVEKQVYQKKGRRLLIIEMIVFVFTRNVLNMVFIAVFSVILFLTLSGILKNNILKV